MRGKQPQKTMAVVPVVLLVEDESKNRRNDTRRGDAADEVKLECLLDRNDVPCPPGRNETKSGSTAAEELTPTALYRRLDEDREQCRAQ